MYIIRSWGWKILKHLKLAFIWYFFFLKSSDTSPRSHSNLWSSCLLLQRPSLRLAWLSHWLSWKLLDWGSMLAGISGRPSQSIPLKETMSPQCGQHYPIGQRSGGKGKMTAHWNVQTSSLSASHTWQKKMLFPTVTCSCCRSILPKCLKPGDCGLNSLDTNCELGIIMSGMLSHWCKSLTKWLITFIV